MQIISRQFFYENLFVCFFWEEEQIVRWKEWFLFFSEWL